MQAGGGRLQRRILGALSYRARRWPRLSWPLHFLGNGLGPTAWRRFDPDLLVRAARFGFHSWPMKIRDDVHRRDVLEVGCGEGYQAIGYVMAGVASYVGVDPTINWERDRVKRSQNHAKQPFGSTPRAIMQRFDHVRLHEGTLGDGTLDGRFDVAVAHNVTEHLMEFDLELERIWRALRPGGLFAFHHHSFQCWNGHHRRPRFVSEIDPDDPEQQRVMDWAHLHYPLERGGYVATRVNRLRLDDLRSLLEEWFVVETWEEEPTDEARGAGRLTAEIRARHPEYSERELLTQGVFCRARRRERGAVGSARVA